MDCSKHFKATHDEVSFSSKMRRIQRGSTKTLPFYDKGCGKCIMVSECLAPVRNPQLPEGAANLSLTRIATNYESVQRLSSARMVDIGGGCCEPALQPYPPLLRKVYSGHQALFYFDNATDRVAYAPDALKAELLNLRPGGMKPVLRNGFNPLTQLPRA